MVEYRSKRIYSKYLFIYCDPIRGIAFGSSNMIDLAKRIDIRSRKPSTIVNWITRGFKEGNGVFADLEEGFVVKVDTDLLFKSNRGGLENFGRMEGELI